METQGRIEAYLDNNATTRIAPEVVEAMQPYFTERFGNPSSQHVLGAVVDKAVEHAREQVAELIGAAHPDEVIFTSCATESDNTALHSALWAQPQRHALVTTPVEHPAIIATCDFLRARGTDVRFVRVDEHGRLDEASFAALLDDEVALASVMWANNETGNIYAVPHLAEMAAARGVMFHTDAVQAVGKIPVNVRDTAVAMLSFSGHKLHAPKGVGVLYVRRGTRFVPFMKGGHQERGRRAGTENVPYIVGLGKACELARLHLEEMSVRVASLRDRLERGLLQAVPECFVTGDTTCRTPNTTNLAFRFVEGEAITLMLNEYGIACSSGSACSSSSLEPSHVMRAMGVPFEAAHGTIRFSLSRYTTDAEVDLVLAKVPEIIATLRSMSPYWKDGKPVVLRQESFVAAME